MIADLLPIAPVILLLLGAAFALLVGTARAADPPPGRERGLAGWAVPAISLVSILSSGYCLRSLSASRAFEEAEEIMGGALVFDGFGISVAAVVLAATFLVALLAAGSSRTVTALKLREGEFHALLLLASSGTILLAMSRHFLTLLLSLELVAISSYVLAGSRRDDARSLEAALKYLVIGGLGTAFLVFGAALFYGATGSFSLMPEHWLTWTNLPRSSLLAAAAAFLLVGFLLKAGAVPFHQWVPDVYEGAPTAATAYMASVVKLGAFAVLARVLAEAFSLRLAAEGWTTVIAAVALLTMIVGNVVALAQTSVKRMLAYSAVAHSGYLLLAFLRSAESARAPLVFYLLAYSMATIGAFAVVSVPKRSGGEHETLDDFRGLGRRAPALALAMLLFLASLAGIPILGGFWAKVYVFSEAVAGGWTSLAVVGVLASAVSLYYYLRVAVRMYMSREYVEGPEDPLPEEQPDAPAAPVVVIYLAAALVVVMGVMQGGFIDWIARLAG